MDSSLLIRNLNTSKLKLTSDNLKIFDDIIIYLRTSNLKEMDIEIILQDLLDMFLHPNNITKEISEIIGTSDYKKYLDSIIKEHKPTLLNLLKENRTMVIFYIFINTAFYGVIGELFSNKFIKKQDFKLENFDFTIGIIISMLIFIPSILIIFKLISIDTFKAKTYKNSFKSFLKMYFCIIIIILIQILINLIFKNFTSIIIFTLPSIFILIPGIIANSILIIEIVKLMRR